MTHDIATEGYETVSSSQHYASDRTTVRIDEIRLPDGVVTQREIIEHLSAVAAVVIDEDDNVVMVNQYRHAFERRMWEIPAGVLDLPGEDLGTAMQRELAEEVELHAGSLVPLVTYANSAGWSDEQTTVFLATELRPALRPDEFVLEGEESDMVVGRIPFDEAMEMVQSGQISDGKTVTGLFAVAYARAVRRNGSM